MNVGEFQKGDKSETTYQILIYDVGIRFNLSPCEKKEEGDKRGKGRWKICKTKRNFKCAYGGSISREYRIKRGQK